MGEQQALLWVLSEPGSEVTEAEFHGAEKPANAPLTRGQTGTTTSMSRCGWASAARHHRGIADDAGYTNF